MRSLEIGVLNCFERFSCSVNWHLKQCCARFEETICEIVRFGAMNSLFFLRVFFSEVELKCCHVTHTKLEGAFNTSLSDLLRAAQTLSSHMLGVSS
jgi:hypothetical protein